MGPVLVWLDEKNLACVCGNMTAYAFCKVFCLCLVVGTFGYYFLVQFCFSFVDYSLFCTHRNLGVEYVLLFLHPFLVVQKLACIKHFRY